MYSIASWSPSQSDPLMVSYMCQSQLSSDMLASAAPMPPCAATVCERVGNTFDSTATDSPASASCSDARMPEPPAPMTIASNLRTGSVMDAPPRLRPHSSIRPLRCLSRGHNSRLETARRRSCDAPQQLQRPAEIADQRDDGESLQEEADAGWLDVVHQDVAHADPRVVEERDHEQERGELEAAVAEEIGPLGMVDAAVPQH